MNTLKQFVLMSVLAGAMVACNSATDNKKDAADAQNPFFTEFTTLHGTYPFESIKLEHYMPAFEEGMKQQMEEVNAIINNEEAPTFENTIVALDDSGELLNLVASVFYNLTSAETNPQLDSLAQVLAPQLSAHSNAINLNEDLFARIKVVYEQKDNLGLNQEQMMLLEDTYNGFAENGANLSPEDKQRYNELSAKLSGLTLDFGQNVLKATNGWSKLITDEALLAGMPEDVKGMLRSNALKKEQEGWLLDLKPTCYVPAMKYLDNRELRQEIWTAHNTIAGDGEFSNKNNAIEIANTRMQIANLLGHKTHADYVLKNRMAENKENVYNLINQLSEAYMPAAQKEYQELQQFAQQLGFDAQIQPWDWSYYSEKLKNERFSISDEVLRPYFKLENVKNGVFGLATKLYGIKFTKNDKIQVYHPEVDAYEVTDENGDFLAVLYTDFHPREGKRAGAWMSEFKGQWKEGEVDSRPHIIIVMNFTRPTEDKPALLTYDELTTFLHEFGHALHGMLTKCTYKSLSGTNVYRDFVELPSQVMENWASEKAFLDEFAVHYETGEKISEELIQKIKDAENFNAGYACLRQLSFASLDMAWHTIETPFEGDPVKFEKEAMKPTDVVPAQPNTALTTSFNHIFAGGYAAGYYGYKWAEVLDADAFSLFQENGIFDQATADSFRRNILEKGGTEHPMVLYKNFRGQEPQIDALLRRNGVK